MVRTRTVVAVVLAGLCLAGAATLVAANDTARGDPDIDAYAPETAFVPGEEATLSITLNNRGDLREGGFDNLENEVLTAHETTIRLLTGEEADDAGYEDVPFDVRTGEQAVGDVPQGPAGPFEFTVVPDEDAEPGVYEVPVELEYRNVRRAEQDDGATVRSERVETETVAVEVEITDRAQFAVIDVDGEVQAGASGTVNVTMRNVAEEPARDASVTASPVDPDLSFTSGAGATDTYVERWEPGENRTFTYRVDADAEATQRPSTFELDVDYRDGEFADAQARTVRTGLTPLPEQAFAATGLDSTLRVGEDGEFTAEVVNDGPRNVSDVIIILDNEASAIDGVAQDPVPTDPNVVPRDTQVTVGDLAVGESTNVTFEAGVRSDAAPGNRTLNVVTRYRTVEDDLVVSEPLDVVVSVAESRDVFAVSPADPATHPENATPGDTVRYDVVVRNDGDDPVRNVQAKLFANDPLDADDDEAFITELGPGEETTVSFRVDIDGGASPKAYAAAVDFRYDDADGDQQLSDTYRVPFVVVEAPDTGLFGLLTHPASLVGLFVVGALAVYKRGRIAAVVGNAGRRLRGN